MAKTKTNAKVRSGKTARKPRAATAAGTATAAASGITVPRANVGAAVQGCIADGATRVLAEECSATLWTVTPID
jgi:hypothetical protein